MATTISDAVRAAQLLDNIAPKQNWKSAFRVAKDNFVENDLTELVSLLDKLPKPQQKQVVQRLKDRRYELIKSNTSFWKFFNNKKTVSLRNEHAKWLLDAITAIHEHKPQLIFARKNKPLQQELPNYYFSHPTKHFPTQDQFTTRPFHLIELKSHKTLFLWRDLSNTSKCFSQGVSFLPCNNKQFKAAVQFSNLSNQINTIKYENNKPRVKLVANVNKIPKPLDPSLLYFDVNGNIVYYNGKKTIRDKIHLSKNLDDSWLSTAKTQIENLLPLVNENNNLSSYATICGHFFSQTDTSPKNVLDLKTIPAKNKSNEFKIKTPLFKPQYVKNTDPQALLLLLRDKQIQELRKLGVDCEFYLNPKSTATAKMNSINLVDIDDQRVTLRYVLATPGGLRDDIVELDYRNLTDCELIEKLTSTPFTDVELADWQNDAVELRDYIAQNGNLDTCTIEIKDCPPYPLPFVQVRYTDSENKDRVVNPPTMKVQGISDYMNAVFFFDFLSNIVGSIQNKHTVDDIAECKVNAIWHQGVPAVSIKYFDQNSLQEIEQLIIPDANDSDDEVWDKIQLELQAIEQLLRDQKSQGLQVFDSLQAQFPHNNLKLYSNGVGSFSIRYTTALHKQGEIFLEGIGYTPVLKAAEAIGKSITLKQKFDKKLSKTGYQMTIHLNNDVPPRPSDFKGPPIDRQYTLRIRPSADETSYRIYFLNPSNLEHQLSIELNSEEEIDEVFNKIDNIRAELSYLNVSEDGLLKAKSSITSTKAPPIVTPLNIRDILTIYDEIDFTKDDGSTHTMLPVAYGKKFDPSQIRSKLVIFFEAIEHNHHYKGLSLDPKERKEYYHNLKCYTNDFLLHLNKLTDKRDRYLRIIQFALATNECAQMWMMGVKREHSFITNNIDAMAEEASFNDRLLKWATHLLLGAVDEMSTEYVFDQDPNMKKIFNADEETVAFNRWYTEVLLKDGIVLEGAEGAIYQDTFSGKDGNYKTEKEVHEGFRRYVNSVAVIAHFEQILNNELKCNADTIVGDIEVSLDEFVKKHLANHEIHPQFWKDPSSSKAHRDRYKQAITMAEKQYKVSLDALNALPQSEKDKRGEALRQKEIENIEADCLVGLSMTPYDNIDAARDGVANGDQDKIVLDILERYDTEKHNILAKPVSYYWDEYMKQETSKRSGTCNSDKMKALSKLREQTNLAVYNGLDLVELTHAGVIGVLIATNKLEYTPV